MVPKIALRDVPVRILLINASPRGRNNTAWLIEKAAAGAQSVGNVEIEQFDFKGKKMNPCTGCTPYCEKNKVCVHDDDFAELTEKWLRADGIIWGMPVYTFGPPAQVRSWMDRFGEVFFQNARDKGRPLLRFAKPTGVMVQGSSRFGGQEIAAQAMLQHIIMEDCIPVSGDMPPSDQGVLAQVVDKTTPENDQDLLHAAYRMGVRVAEMTKIVKVGKLSLASALPDVYWYSKTQLGDVCVPTKERLLAQEAPEAAYIDLLRSEDVRVKILAINGSPRIPKRSNSQLLLDAAKAAVAEHSGVEIVEYSFARKKIAPCRMCISYCSQHEECVNKDDFQEFRSKWLGSDGIIWSVPIYHMGPPSQVRAALDRMNELRFQTKRAHNATQYPRLCKAGGTIVQGGTRYGGQEITQQFFLHHFLLLQCVPVTADMPESYLGVCAHGPSREALLADKSAFHLSGSLGNRVTEMAKIIKAGLMLTQDSLPDEYFPSLEKMGLCERRVIE